MAEHTPGPWAVEGARVVAFDASMRLLVAQVNVVRTGEERTANAHLIASAPDLLAACREMLSVVDEAYAATGYIKTAETSTQRQRIEAAIARAEGRTS